MKLSDFPVEKMREHLRGIEGYEDVTVNALKGRTAVIQELLQYYNLQHEEDLIPILDDSLTVDVDFDSIEEIPNVPVIEDDGIPEYGSEGWTKYVLSHFKPNEMREGLPLVPGLVRVARKVLGNILDDGPLTLDWAGPDDYNRVGAAAVVYQVIVEIYGQPRTFRAVGDGSFFSVAKEEFSQYPGACAETKARSRAFRKALAIDDVLTADEIGADSSRLNSLIGKQSFEFSPTDKSSSIQHELITKQCKQLGIDVLKLINLGEGKYDRLEDVTKETALKILDYLSDFLRTDVEHEIPESIRLTKGNK